MYPDLVEPAGANAAPSQLRPIPMSEELLDLFDSMDSLIADFKALDRPAGLPPPGEPLPVVEEGGQQEDIPENDDHQADDTTVQSTSREHLCV